MKFKGSFLFIHWKLYAFIEISTAIKKNRIIEDFAIFSHDRKLRFKFY